MLSEAAFFEFDYVGLKHYKPSPDGRRVFAIFGRLVTGRLRLCQPIAVPTANGELILGEVGNFAGSFWFSHDLDKFVMGFVNAVEAGPEAYCVVIVAPSSELEPSCPGKARQPAG